MSVTMTKVAPHTVKKAFPYTENIICYIFLAYGMDLVNDGEYNGSKRRKWRNFILGCLRIGNVASQLGICVLYCCTITILYKRNGASESVFDAIGAFIVIIFSIVSNIVFLLKRGRIREMLRGAKSAIAVTWAMSRKDDAGYLEKIYRNNCRIVYMAWGIAFVNRTVNNVVPVVGRSQLRFITETLKSFNFGAWRDRDHLMECNTTCVVATYSISIMYAIQIYMFSIGTLCLFALVCIFVDIGFHGLQMDTDQCRLKGWNGAKFAHCRRLHGELCSLVSKMENVFAPIVLCLCACYLPTACIWLRAITVAQVGSVWAMLALVFRSMGMHIVFMLLTTYGSKINSKVQMTVPIVDDEKFDTLVPEHTRALVNVNCLLYANKLSCNPPMLSGYGFLPINKGLIASIFSTVVTYTLVLYKVKV